MNSITEWDAREARMEALGVTYDDWPCRWCGLAYDQHHDLNGPHVGTYCHDWNIYEPVSDWLTDLEHDRKATP